MDLDALPVDDECYRARQSEYVDMSLIHLGLKLREMGVDFAEEDIAAVPTPFADRLLRYVVAFEEKEATTRAAIAEYQAQTEQELKRLESQREATERARGEVAILSERISADLSEYRKEEKLEAERRRERLREVQDLCRQIDKKELELRRETMEHDRLSKMLKKVRK
ncbi:hypothetical protein DQ04_00601180 [Trypanosoma grayi]|uniref:hypothetical protein n=1 Tax=Trypanosoma grayi TaxID=71804 RepID=UPI0004F4074C|nr:hypothetical protein DQ04_00601180 [Trypanosoma grayi]KEG14151.1 hypothetical protein DQ04_00601180 [Trypanosoma grayi]